MQLNLTREHVQRFGIEPGKQVELELATERYYAIAARTFADARGGEIILYEDAYENIAIAISGGSAAETFSAQPGVDVRIRFADVSARDSRTQVRPVHDEPGRPPAAALAALPCG